MDSVLLHNPSYLRKTFGKKASYNIKRTQHRTPLSLSLSLVFDFGMWLLFVNLGLFLLFHVGWARFCLLNRVVHAVLSKRLRQCDTKEVHCRREGHEGHMKCLEANSGCMNPIRDLGVCTMVFNYCIALEKDLPDSVKMMLQIMKMNFNIGE